MFIFPNNIYIDKTITVYSYHGLTLKLLFSQAQSVGNNTQCTCQPPNIGVSAAPQPSNTQELLCDNCNQLINGNGASSTVPAAGINSNCPQNFSQQQQNQFPPQPPSRGECEKMGNVRLKKNLIF